MSGVRRQGAPCFVRGASVEKLETGIPGLDIVLGGGIPRGSLVLVTGPAGSGKTILTTQLAFRLARGGRKTLMLTALSEANSKLIAYLDGLEYFDPSVIGGGIQILNIQRLLTDDGLAATLSEIRASVVEQGIELLIVDSMRSLHLLTGDEIGVQSFIFGLGSALFIVGCTVVLVEDESAAPGVSSAAEAISDTVLRLDVARMGRAALRRLEVTKLRGANPLGGKHSFEITSDGLEIYPRIESLPMSNTASPSEGRLSWGVPGLDELTGGGVPQGTVTLLVGSPGVGKTTMATQFVAEGLERGERCLYVATHETADELTSHAAERGIDLNTARERGALTILDASPSDGYVDRTLNQVMDLVRSTRVDRLVIDVIDAIERETVHEARVVQVVSTLTRFLRSHGVSVLFVRDLPLLLGSMLEFANPLEATWSVVDNVILIRHVELEGSVPRTLNVLKMRGSAHDIAFHSVEFTGDGLRVGGVLEGFQGLLIGMPRRVGTVSD